MSEQKVHQGEASELQPDQARVRHHRAMMTAAAGLVVSIIVTVVLFGCAAQVPDTATSAVGFVALLASLGWLYPLLETYLEKRVDQEAIDIEYLKSQSAKRSLFSLEDDYSTASRLTMIRKWVVPIISVVLAAIALYMSFVILQGEKTATGGENQAVVIAGFIQAFIGFITFLLARFTAGLSVQDCYGALRAPAGLSMLAALAAALSAASRATSYFDWPLGAHIVVWFVGIALGLYAVEVLVGVLMHIYSTRKETRRPPHDSRLLFLFASPGRAARSIGEVLDYQFGFEVSKSTMYRSFEKGIAPFLIVQAVLLWICSCITVIDAGSLGFVERFGRRVSDDALTPGVHVTMPWPIEQVRTVEVGAAQSFHLGLLVKDQEVRIWNDAHGQAEETMVVASAESKGDEVPVNLLAASYTVIYKVNPEKAISWEYDYVNASSIFESKSKALLMRYLTTVDFFDIMGEGRSKSSSPLTQELDSLAADMGIELIFTGFVGAHPPVPVADSFEGVVKADEAKQARLLEAESKKNRLTASATYEAEVMLIQAQGEAAEIVESAKGDSERFGSQVIGYKEAPELYKTRRKLEMLKQSTAGSRKYIVPADTPRVDVLNLEEKLRADITDLDLEGLAE